MHLFLSYKYNKKYIIIHYNKTIRKQLENN